MAVNCIKCDNCGAVQKNRANLCCEYCMAVLKDTPAIDRWKELQKVTEVRIGYVGTTGMLAIDVPEYLKRTNSTGPK